MWSSDHRLSCEFGRDGGTMGNAGTVTVTTVTPSPFTCAPVLAAVQPQANGTIALAIRALPTLDTPIDVHSVDFVYFSKQ